MFFLLVAVGIYAQDETYYEDLLTNLELANMADRESSYYITLKTLQILCNNPKIFINMEEAYPHTYAWYLWNDYNAKPNGISKLIILQQIEQLNK